jgi:subtilisin family serine protease
MSWGYSGAIGNDFTVITSVDYRGTTYDTNNDARWHESNTYMSETYGLYPDYDGEDYRVPARVASVDSDVEEMIDAGIHVCIAAGNNSFKADISTGIDYNNTAFIPTLGGAGPYHRGSSPLSEEAFMVGSIDSSTHSSSLEQISSFSTRGPLVNIYAPGSNIRSAFSNTNEHNDSNYYLNSSYKQGSISGTSMASPQVCGLGATILELNPHLTPAQLLQKMTNLATDDMLHSTSLNNDYNDTRSLLGSNNKFLNTPFNSQYPLTT